ncbi:TetR/AcrR family transcriptional regulator [Nocardioides sp. JQ2195]|uniref:TetR/AcrR family transcriptional regulator n=1 Tax=Nocardioides sp. JQ2195 TaxID=2592334 RepID=UPI00143EBD3F|nr:TetR/AcrR family transcriptional regulator [Nocardioides sp. JQ2195]QIX26572.1 TetR/AcrR family transcriptional regulator [Nocardioides sp. JQ2195]
MPPTDRRSRILESAATLFAEKGINASTVRDIADGVGILSGSLYHHFDSKDAMVEAIVVEYLEALTKRYTAAVLPHSDPRAQLHELVLASLQVVQEHEHASEIYQANRKYFEGSDRFNSVRDLAAAVQVAWAEVIDTGVRSGVFRADVNPRVFHRFLRDAVFLASRWYHPSEVYSIEDLAEDTARIFLDGFTVAGSRLS